MDTYAGLIRVLAVRSGWIINLSELSFLEEVISREEKFKELKESINSRELL